MRTILNMRLMIFFLLASLNANAVNMSQFFHRPAPKTQEMAFGLNYAYTETTGVLDDGTPVNSTAQNYLIPFYYSYGLANWCTVRMDETAELKYSHRKNGNTILGVGFENLKPSVEFYFSTSHSGFIFGLPFSISPAPAFIDNKDNSNNYTGGDSVSPFFGYEHYEEKSVFGIKVSQQINIGPRFTDTIVLGPSGTPLADSSNKAYGGEESSASVFFERFVGHFDLGGDFSVAYTANSSSQLDGNSHSLSPFWQSELYAPYETKSGTWIPKLSYTTSTGSVEGPDTALGLINVNSYYSLTAALNYRLTF